MPLWQSPIPHDPCALAGRLPVRSALPRAVEGPDGDAIFP